VSVVANVAINVDASKALGQLKSVDQASKGLDGGFKGAAAAAKGLGGAIAAALGPIALVTAAVAGLKAGFELLGTKQADVANLERGLTGLVANSKEAAKTLVGIADQLGKQTLFNEEDFTKGFKLLTSFKSIATDSYERVAIAAADVAEVTGQDLNGSLMQLSKALEDPAKGLTALARSGTTFTQQQKDQVKALVDSGKKLEAQDLILKELEKQYGGAAKAAGSAGFAGAMDTLGEVVRDLQRALAAVLESPLKAFFDLLGQAVGRVAEGYEYLNEVIRTQVLPILQPLIDKIKEVVGEFDITTLIDLWQGGLVIAIRLVVDALRVVVPVAVQILDTLAAIGNNPVFQALIAPLKAVVENLLDARGEITQFQEQSKGSKDALQGISDISKELPDEIDEATEQMKLFTGAAEESLSVVRQQVQAFDAQVESLERGASVNAARYAAELAINKLKGEQLAREYEFAKTAQQRLNIAYAIFRQQAEAAQIEYKQALENIALEKEKAVLQVHAAGLKYDEIQAEGKLQILKAKNVDEEQKKRRQLEEALNAQTQVFDAAQEQVRVQQEISKFQEQTADAQFKSKILAAQNVFENKLVSKEIGISGDRARQLSDRLAASISPTRTLEGATRNVASNAQQSSYMFIEVAKSADQAANQIIRAADAQARLNSLRSQAATAPTTVSAPVQGAANGAFWTGGFSAFAKGGVVTKPTLGLIGEGGESEYIVPESKAAAFAANYLSGARGSNAIPRFAEGGYVGPINVQTGPVMQQDGQQYVSMGDLESAMQTVVNTILGNGRTPGGRRYSGVG
jgi:hypothetical protein